MTDTDASLTPHTVLRPGDVLDTYSTADGTVVIVGGTAGHRVVRLSPLGEAVRTAVGPGRTVPELEAELRSQLGDPASGNLPRLVMTAVLSLVEEGVIVAGQGPKDDNSGVTRS
jgi:hypothetical protein